jgi:dTDP-4-amino-4,6-dideoxygalactose transaminase
MIPITKPTLPSFESIKEEIKELFSTGMVTNHKYVAQLECAIQAHLGVKHAIAVSSCTSGLMLVMKALELKGNVIVPSFTFSASGHAIVWNGLTPKFVEIDPTTQLLDLRSVREAIDEETSAIMAVHMFGCPAPVQELQGIAKEHNLKLIFDAAHAMGAKLNSTYVGGFGDAEVFSCSPTKLFVTGEGGIVTTNNDELARKIRIGRVYGDPGDYNCEFPGLSARMGEFNALLGLKSLEILEENIERRNDLAQAYKQQLQNIPGIGFQKILPELRSTFKDFSITINPKVFGMDRDQLSEELLKEGIQTKKYFYPPLHEQKAYSQLKEIYQNKLPVTQEVSRAVLSLPLYSHMTTEEVELICSKIIETTNK